MNNWHNAAIHPTIIISIGMISYLRSEMKMTIMEERSTKYDIRRTKKKISYVV